MAAIGSHAGSDAAHERGAQVLGNATTALMGRLNDEGFYGYWPPVAQDEAADERDRAMARRGRQGRVLDHDDRCAVGELTDRRRRSSRGGAAAPQHPGGDILVVNSTSIVRQLVAADELDRLVIDLVPEIMGDGARLFDDGLPSSSWTLSATTIADDGTVLLTYDRSRERARPAVGVRRAPL